MRERKPKIDGLGELLVVRLWATQVLLETRLQEELAKIGLSTAEFRLVGELLMAPEGLRQGVLAERLGVRAPTVSAAVARMEKAGIVKRKTDPDDPRARLVTLSPNAPVHVGATILEDIDREITDCFTDEERKQFASLLDKLHARMAVSASVE